MILGMDTSGKYLNLALIDNDKTTDYIHEECFKHQSERILPEIDNLLKRNNLSHDDIEAFVLTRGPGSYTGVRIAMTLAKVWASVKKLPVYTVSSLQLYAGNKEMTAVYLDARAHRGYTGFYNLGYAVEEDSVYTEEDFREFTADKPDWEVISDTEEFGNNITEDICLNFLKLKKYWEKVENVDALVPVYLKDALEYKV